MLQNELQSLIKRRMTSKLGPLQVKLLISNHSWRREVLNQLTEAIPLPNSRSFFYLKPSREAENAVCPPRRGMSVGRYSPLCFTADNFVSCFSAMASGKSVSIEAQLETGSVKCGHFWLPPLRRRFRWELGCPRRHAGSCEPVRAAPSLAAPKGGALRWLPCAFSSPQHVL